MRIYIFFHSSVLPDEEALCPVLSFHLRTPIYSTSIRVKSTLRLPRGPEAARLRSPLAHILTSCKNQMGVGGEGWRRAGFFPPFFFFVVGQHKSGGGRKEEVSKVLKQRLNNNNNNKKSRSAQSTSKETLMRGSDLKSKKASWLSVSIEKAKNTYR